MYAYNDIKMHDSLSQIVTKTRNKFIFQYLSQMGYCPQHHALIRSLNAQDHLKLFALLRGVPKSQVNLEVGKWINRLSKKLLHSFSYFSALIYFHIIV